MSHPNESFLKQLAITLYKIHGQGIEKLTIVFPNRRAGLFFTEYLNRIINGPTFSPEIITIQELFSNISNLRSEDPLPLIFHLYKCYKELSSSKETFDEFYLWGEMLLRDFDQVDKYLVDAELLFTNITDLKEIDEQFYDWNEERKEEIRHFWKSLVGGKLKHDQKEFARLWQVLFPIYKKFKEELSAGKIAYEGMLFRDAVENYSAFSNTYTADRLFIVAGFNALNGCEKKLFHSFQERMIVTFYWDYDLYYLNDNNQEAGLFMRENLKLFPPSDLPVEIDSFHKSKDFKILHSPSQIGQAQIAAKEISQLGDLNVDFDDMAIVLCDEELLLPVLSAVPQEFEKVNVTMGLPLKLTPLFSLINLLVSLQKKYRIEGKSLVFHYKSVIDILNNQLIQSIYPIECKSIVKNIIQKNQLFVPQEELGKNELFRKIFAANENVSTLPEYFLAILFDLFHFWEKRSKESYAINYQEYIYQVYISINKLNNTLFVEGLEIMGSNNYLTRETFFRLLLQYLGALNVSFEGEPLSGLQIMGILETRTLDFKNIVLLSVNEGIMPKANASGSFIPYHLRRGVGLPTIEEQNAMYAYYFYRLLQRAEKVTFVYNSGSNGLRTGEKSRFLYQLQLESPFNTTEKGIENTIEPIPRFPIAIEKKGRVLDILNGILESGRILSPTALDQYVQCPLSFYFKYIARFEEEEEVSSEVDARMFGKLFHAVMEALYQPFVNMTIDDNILRTLIADKERLEKVLTEAFNVYFFKAERSIKRSVITGRNHLVFEVIQKMVLQTLESDRNKIPFRIEGLEQKLSATISIFNGSGIVRIGGYVDRIDSLSGDIEIIDYKTGATEHNINKLSDLFDKDAKKRNKAALQTLIYGCIWDRSHQETTAVYPCIYALRNIFQKENRRLTIKENNASEVNYTELKHEFEPLLISLLEEIFNPSLPFTQTTVEERCQYCNYLTICGKQSTQS